MSGHCWFVIFHIWGGVLLRVLFRRGSLKRRRPEWDIAWFCVQTSLDGHYCSTALHCIPWAERKMKVYSGLCSIWDNCWEETLHQFRVQTSFGGRYCSTAPHVTVSGEEKQFIWNFISSSVSQNLYLMFNGPCRKGENKVLMCSLVYWCFIVCLLQRAGVNFLWRLLRNAVRSIVAFTTGDLTLRLRFGLMRNFAATFEVLLTSRPIVLF